jgi:hypothetical protein
MLLDGASQWWGFSPTSGVAYYHLQLTSSRQHAVSWILGMPGNVTLREAGWRTLVEVHSGLVLTMDAGGNAVRLTEVQDGRSAFKVLPMSGSSFQFFSGVAMTVPLGVGVPVPVPVGARLRPVLFGNPTIANASIANGQWCIGVPFLGSYTVLISFASPQTMSHQPDTIACA